MAKRVRLINRFIGIMLLIPFVFSVAACTEPMKACAAESGTETGLITDYNEDYYDSYAEATEDVPALFMSIDGETVGDDVSTPDTDGVVVCSSVEEAGNYLRSCMVKRLDTAEFILGSAGGYTGQQGFLLIKSEAFKETGNPKEGDYLYWNYAGLKGRFETVENGILYTLNLEFLSTAAEEREIDAEVARLMDNEFKGWKNMSDFEITKEVYEWITDNYTFVSGGDRHSTYSGIIEHETVCQGFATSAYRLLGEMGISSRIIANDEHGWNIVKIGDLYYNIDATWDVGLIEMQWKYFLLCNKSFDDGMMHDRGSRFTTAEFNKKYPMAGSDYDWTPEIRTVSINYRTHVQSYGWQDWVSDGEMSGTEGQSKRLEGINIELDNTDNLDIGVEYMTHVQSYGWESDWRPEGSLSGTVGKGKRLEAIKIRLVGSDSDLYDVYYRVHVQSYGWLGWAKNGDNAGTAGFAKRLEGIEIVVLPKGDKPEGLIGYSFIENSRTAFENNSTTGMVNYITHVQTHGWQQYVSDGSISGTIGEAKRLEGIGINLANIEYTGGIRYRTHIQSFGWEDVWKQDGALSGTVGMGKRLEAIQVELYGEAAQHYDVYYRVHAQSYGWLGWAKNGSPAGTAGLSKRLEAVQIVVLPKGSAAPGNAGGAFIAP